MPGLGRIEIVHNFTGETGYVILVPHKTTAPLADVICIIDGVAAQTRKTYAAPHSQQSVLFEDLDTVMYFITAYRSADGIALDEQINILACDAKSGAQYPITKYDYVVDRGLTGDPIDGDSGLRDSRLLNKKYWVEERGTGTMMDQDTSAELTDRSDDGGGFDWTDSFKKFNSGAVYIVFVIERTDFVSAGPSSSGTEFSDVVVITTTVDFDSSTMASKLLIINSTDTVVQLTMQNLALLPDLKFRLNTHSGSQRNAVIQLDAGDTVKFNGEDRNSIILGKGEDIEILIKNNVMYVMNPIGDFDKVGERSLVSALSKNGLQLNGTVYQQADVPRLMWYLDNKADAGEIVAEGVSSGQWSYSTTIDGETVYPYKGKYARDNGAGTIRVPDDRLMVYKALNALTGDAERVTQGVGGYQHDANKLHGHDVGVSGVQTVTTNRSVQKSAQPNDPYSPGSDPSNPIIKPSGSVEARVKNRGMIAQVII